MGERSGKEYLEAAISFFPTPSSVFFADTWWYGIDMGWFNKSSI